MASSTRVTALEKANQGFSLAAQGKLIEAIDAYRAALSLEPNWAEAHFNLGIALRRAGQTHESVNAYGRAIACKPDFALAHNNLGNVWRGIRQIDKAVECLRQAIEIDPSFAEGWNNLGAALKDRAELDEALTCFDQARVLAPHRADIASNRIYLLHFHPRYSEADICREQKIWATRYAAALAQLPLTPPIVALSRRLRIGYVSPNFRDHCQSLFMLPLLRNHDHERFEIFCYSDVENEDEKTHQLRRHADVWREIVGMPSRAVADLISRDGIDILFDLTQHMAGNRLAVFAHRPAPVQAAWLGYPGGTGLDAINFRLTDPCLETSSAGSDCYAEKPICLPDTFWCFDPQFEMPAVNALPALSNGYVTFGCLNNFCKVNDGVLAQWSRILASVPNSRLLLLAPRGMCRHRVIETLRNHQIANERISFADFQPRPQYLELYHQIDIALDTFPYNGHTTSLDSLWMGVPVVTLVGNTPVGRAGLSLLSNVGVAELACANAETFDKAARELAGNLPKLAALRNELRGRMRESPLMNSKRFTKNFESACRAMWKSHRS
jgi:predicted O-linked N-acetylglucosamine transferase (SPINDLY family)